MNLSIEDQLDAARARVDELTAELDETNRGIVALHNELDAAREAEARARAEHEVMAERDRIASNLHDLVIQRVFGASIALQGIASLIHQPATVARIRTVIRELDATIKELRTTIFGLHDQPQRAASLRAQLLDLATEAQDAKGRSPTIEFQGPIDAAVPDHIATDLLGVTRIALATIASHTGTTHTEILVSATDEILLHVTVGPEEAIPPAALDDFRARAAVHGGTLTVTSTQLDWRARPTQ